MAGKIFFLMLLLGAFAHTGNAQLPGADRRTDWTRAGIKMRPTVYQHVFFSGIADGTTDNSSALSAILDTLKRPTYILFGPGDFFFSKTIFINKQVVLKGFGANNTRLRFQQGMRHEPSIEIRGTELTPQYSLLETASRGDLSMVLHANITSNFKPGDYFRLIQNDTDLVFDRWAGTRTGQIGRVDSIKSGRLYFSSPLRMDYPLSRTPRIRKVNMLEGAGVECLKIIREDYSNSGNGSSNIELRFAAQCSIKAVESQFCNYAHIEVYYGTNINIEDCYFQDAHNFGSGGRAYGVMLHFATGEVLVQNNVFRRLRHAMIVQGGANGNVFAYNYAYEGRKEIFPGINIPGEDMVCHGNYPYLNLFEGNHAQFGHVDDSHGQNGPHNTYFRNLAATAGFAVSGNLSPHQNFTGNHRLSDLGSFASAGHHITDNSWQGPSGLSVRSLAYTIVPAFLSGYEDNLIGPSQFDPMISIPARDRALQNTFTGTDCTTITWNGSAWEDGFSPSSQTGHYRLKIMPGGKILLSGTLKVKSLSLAPGTDITLAPGSRLDILE